MTEKRTLSKAQLETKVDAALEVTEDWRTDVDSKLVELKKGHDAILLNLQANTTATEQACKLAASVKEDTRSVVESFEAMQGGLKVLGWLGKISAAVSALLTLAGIAWYVITHGWHLPPPR